MPGARVGEDGSSLLGNMLRRRRMGDFLRIYGNHDASSRLVSRKWGKSVRILEESGYIVTWLE